MSDNIGRELDWNDSIENDGPEYITLPPGDYDFKVIDFERGRYNGGDKIPPCNMANVFLQIEAREGNVTIKHRLFLHSNVEGLLCAFFNAIGQRQKGERVTMNWNAVVGSTGRAKIGIRKWTKDNGEEGTINQVERFYDAPEKKKGYQPGRF